MTEELEKKKITLRLPKFNLWILTTIIFLVLALIALSGWPIELRRPTGMAVAITGDQAAKKAVDYVNNNLVQTGQVSFVSVEELSGVYKVVTSYQDQEIPVYITKDGLYLFISQPLDTSQEIPKEPEQPQEAFSGISEKSKTCLEKIGVDSSRIESCVETKGLTFVQEEFDLCQEHKVSGSPTIFINDNSGDPAKILGNRSVESFKKIICCAFNTPPSECGEIDCTGIDIPKSDKPRLTFFVMSECPFGVSVLKVGVPLYEEFKETVIFEPHYVIYGSKDSPSSMHGIGELNEDTAQLCVLKEESQDMFWDYISCFYGSSQSAPSGSC